MSNQVCLVLLALFSLTAASDQDCEELIKPLEDRNRIFAKWIYYAGASDSETQTNIVKYATSSWIEILPKIRSEDFTFRYGDLIDGKCYYGTGNCTITGNLIKLEYYLRSVFLEFVGTHLETCPNCLLWLHEKEIEGGEITKSVFFFTKTGELDLSYLKVFKKQLKCLNISGEIYFAETKNLCPDEQEGAGEEMTEEP